MQDFVQEARAWAEAMRRGLETRDTALIGDLAAQLAALERRGRALALELRASVSADETQHGRANFEPSERAACLAALSELYRAAHVCAALSESEALYLRWGQTTARPALEYSPKGEPESNAPASTHWEV